MHLRLGFLASGSGSNVEAILNNIENGSLEAEACVILSNNPGAGVLEKGRKHDVPAYVLNKNHYAGYFSLEEAILDVLLQCGLTHVVAAGYMNKVPDNVLRAYRNSVLNIHPALLPKFGGEGMYGMHVHEAVIAAGETESGATVHLMDENYDQGRILDQVKVTVFPDDTPETLQQRVLRYEHVLYSQVLRDIQEGRIDLD